MKVKQIIFYAVSNNWTRKGKQNVSTLLFLTPCIVLLFGYIDPFMGSVLLQTLVAGFLGILIFFKKARFFVAGLFCGKWAAHSETSNHDIDE